MTRDEELARARKAGSILEEPVLKQAFELLEEHYTLVWRNSRPTEVEQREQAYAALFALDQFRRQLRNFLETGILANAAIENTEE